MFFLGLSILFACGEEETEDEKEATSTDSSTDTSTEAVCDQSVDRDCDGSPDSEDCDPDDAAWQACDRRS